MRSEGGFNLDTRTNVGSFESDDDACVISALMASMFSFRSWTRSVDGLGYDMVANREAVVESSLRASMRMYQNDTEPRQEVRKKSGRRS